MTNREAIEAIYANYPPENYTILREALNMAITILKEQPEIVRCKNCKYQDPEQLNDGCSCFVCRKGHIVYRKGQDWFCADGERKDDDA